MSDASQKWLLVMQKATSDVDRVKALEELLALQSGWWGPAPLVTWAYAYAKATARLLLRNTGFSLDRVDWQGEANWALMVLSESASSIKGSPREWLKGVIRNLLKQELRKRFREFDAHQIADDFGAADRRAEETPFERSDEESRARQQWLRDAVQALSPKLREVAEPVLLEGRDAEEIREELNLTPATMRKRMSRIRKALSEKLQNLDDDSDLAEPGTEVDPEP